MSCLWKMLRLLCLYLILNIQCSLYEASPLLGEGVRIADLDEFPFIVAICDKIPRDIEKLESGQFCGGSLITTKHVLTAAHCFIDKQLNSTVVKIGSTDLRNADAYDLKSWQTYTQWAGNHLPIRYNADYIYDIAFIEIYGTISHIKLPTISYTPQAELYGRAAVTAGWGRIEGNKKPRYMRIATFFIVCPEKCNPFITQKDLFLKDLMPKINLCTASIPPATGSCGDSGNPLLFGENNIVGVYISACRPYLTAPLSLYRNLYSSVNAYTEFIEAVKRK